MGIEKKKTSEMSLSKFAFITGVHLQESQRFRRALASGGIEWSSKQPECGTTIADRFLHSAVYFDKSVYIFGGCTATSTTFNDLWRFDLASREWVRPLATGRIFYKIVFNSKLRSKK